MPIIIGKEEKEIIERLNSHLGTSYRTKPYNFKDSNDLIEATTMATAEYLNFYTYYHKLLVIDEDLDQTIETFYPALWVRSGGEGTTGLRKLDSIISLVNSAAAAADKLLEDSRFQCQYIWNIVFTNESDTVLSHFFGDDYKEFKKSAIALVIEEDLDLICSTFDLSSTFDFKGSVNEAVSKFAVCMKQFIIVKKLFQLFRPPKYALLAYFVPDSFR